jgi:hypothetical protein
VSVLGLVKNPKLPLGDVDVVTFSASADGRAGVGGAGGRGDTRLAPLPPNTVDGRYTDLELDLEWP